MQPISIIFRGAELTVFIDHEGRERVSFKKLSDALKIQWKIQKKKLKRGPYYWDLYGVLLMPVKGFDIEPSENSKMMYSIECSKVSLFLKTLNPQQIKAQGNLASASWLINNKQEWLMALKEYRKHKRRCLKLKESYRQPILPMNY